MKPNKYKIVITIVLLCFITAQVFAQVFNSNGIELKETTQRSKRVKIVIDTVRMVSGYGSITLHDSFLNNKHDVSALSNESMNIFITPLLSDTTATLYYYGAVPDSSGSFVWIKSSSVSDNGKVCVLIYVR